CFHRAGVSSGGSFPPQPVFLCPAEPVRCVRPVGEIHEHDHTEQNRGKSLDQKQPLPSSETKHSIQVQKRTGERATNDAAYWDRGHECCYCPCALSLRVPVAQELDHAGEETSLRR